MTRNRVLKRKIQAPSAPVQPPQPAPQQQQEAVLINGQYYSVQPVQQTAIQPYQGYVQPYQSPVTHLEPQPLTAADFFLSWKLWAFVGGCFFVAGVFGYAIVKAALPPPVTPVAAPPPAPAPQPVVIVQAAPPAPPPPIPQPFTEKECRPGGFLGMSEICTSRQGYR